MVLCDNIYMHIVLPTGNQVISIHSEPDLPSLSIKRNIFCLFLVFFENLPPFRFISKFFRFFCTLLVIANTIHRHIEVLLFSISFFISILFGDVETEKNRLILGHRQIKISLYFPSTKIFRIFLPKGGRSSAFIS